MVTFGGESLSNSNTSFNMACIINCIFARESNSTCGLQFQLVCRNWRNSQGHSQSLALYMW